MSLTPFTKRGRPLVWLLLVAALLMVLDGYARGRFSSTTVTASTHFELRGLARQQAQEVLDHLERNYDRVGRDLSTRLASRIRVFVYANRWAYGRATGHWSGSGNVEGPEMIHVLWVGRETGQAAVHEFVHTVTLRLLLDQEPQSLDTARFDRKFASFPVWLWEAIACYEANQAHNPLSFPYMRNGHYPGLLELNQRSKGAKVYDVGYTLVEFIESQWGHDEVIRLIREYGNLQKVLGVSDDEFSKRWAAFVRTKYH